MREGWNHNTQYHELVLRSVPKPCHSALDIGCGKGTLTRRLGECCDEVTGIDIDRNALPLSLDRRKGHVTYTLGDVMTHPLPAGGFDFVTSVAVLHHLALEPALLRFRELLAPGGTLAVIGLYRPHSPVDYAAVAAAWPASRVLRRFRGFAETDAPVRAPEATLAEIRAAAAAHLPGASVQRRLFFRYSLLWHKPQ